MHLKKNNSPNRFIATVLAYILISFALSIALHLFIQNVLMKMPSIPPEVRQGYENTFVSILAITAGLLLVSLVLYGLLINIILSKTVTSKTFRVIVGILVGPLPLIIIYSSTFGITFSDPATIAQLVTMILGGGAFPIASDLLYSKMSGNLQAG